MILSDSGLLSSMFAELFRLDSESGSSSTLSQTSYDPSQPNFRNKDSEIPGLDTVSTDTTTTTGTTESGSESGISITAKKSKGEKICVKLRCVNCNYYYNKTV